MGKISETITFPGRLEKFPSTLERLLFNISGFDSDISSIDYNI
jgi:hypothetical protein